MYGKDKNFRVQIQCLANHSKGRPQASQHLRPYRVREFRTSPPEKSVLPEAHRNVRPSIETRGGSSSPAMPPLRRPASCRLPTAAAIAVNLSESYFLCPSNRLKDK